MATEHLIDPSSLDPEALALRGEVFWGVISSIVGDDIVIAHDGRASLSQRAASCLLAPRPGDVVLVARVERRSFVLAVLEREGRAREVEVDGDLCIRARGGSVTLEADEDVRVRANAGVNITGRTLALAAKQASWVAEHAQILAEQLSLEATRLKQLAMFSESVVESMRETLGHSYRDVRESEHVTAGTLTLSLRGVLRAHAETAIMTAKKLIKLNGEQIHLG